MSDQHSYPPRVAFIGGGPVGLRFLATLSDLASRGRIEFVGGYAAGVIKDNNKVINSTIRKHNGTVYQSTADMIDGHPDAILSVGNTHIFSQEEIDSVGCKIVNFHAAPLPTYRGSACAAFAILNDEAKFGATFHLVHGDLDAGPIVHRVSFPIDEIDTSEMLDHKAITHGVQALAEFGEMLFDGSIEVIEQNTSIEPPYRRRDIEPQRLISMTWDGDRIWKHVRACDWNNVLEPAYILLPNGQKVFLTASARGSWITKPINRSSQA